MGFRFFKRMKIAPGISLNFSKSGPSISLGPRGMKYTIGPRGQRATVGLPGTGLYYTTHLPAGHILSGGKSGAGKTSSPPPASQPQVGPADKLTLGFFQSLTTPDEEKALVAGCHELVQGNSDAALEHLRTSTHLADGAFLAGIILLKKGDLEQAVSCLYSAAEKAQDLGKYLKKYGVNIEVTMSITDEVSAHMEPCYRGTLLALVEAYQRQKKWSEATACLEQLQKLDPQDVLVKLSLAELLMDMSGDKPETCQRVVKLAEGIENDTAIHTALLLYKARALRMLQLFSAARDTLSAGLRKEKDRPAELLRGLRYERALVYEGLGQPQRARAEYEKIYAEAPDYEDVAQRLGLKPALLDETEPAQ